MTLNVLRSTTLAVALTMLALPAAADISMTLHNATDRNIEYFYTSPSSADEWGDDILGDEVLEAGGSGTVTVTGTECEFDIKAVFDDEEEFTDSVNMCETSEYTISEE